MLILQLIYRILYFFRIYMILSPQIAHSFEDFAIKSINQKAAHTNTSISELLLIQQQSDFISQIMKTQINSKKSHTFSTQISEMSFDSNFFDKPRFLNSSVSTISLCKQNSKFFQEDSYDEALNQIKRYCSKKTYNYIRDKLRTRESRNQKKLEKELRYNEQLTLRCLKLTQEVGELKLKLESANEKLKSKQKKKPVIGLNKSIDKGQVYLKWEKSILYKEKIQNEIKKNLNKQLNTLQAQKKQNQLICYKIQNILTRIEEGNGSNDGRTAKMIENISQYIKQRKNMKDQSKQYDSIQKCVEETVKQLKDMIGNLK